MSWRNLRHPNIMRHRSNHAPADPAQNRACGPVDRMVTWSLDAADALEGRRVRRSFAQALQWFGYADDALFCAELAFGEMLGNAVRHAGGRIEIVLDGTGADAVVHVLDEGRGFAAHHETPDDAWAESGRGLRLIRLMTDDFIVSSRPGGGSDVGARLPRRPFTLRHRDYGT
jgi:anti-sigma regulatory factor (Ser/Thr protein kinase)